MRDFVKRRARPVEMSLKAAGGANRIVKYDTTRKDIDDRRTEQDGLVRSGTASVR
jgi:hypothetical protein